MSYMVGVDIGGTFTDCAVNDDEAGRFVTGKAPTTPANPAEGFFNGLDAAASAAGLDARQLLSKAVPATFPAHSPDPAPHDPFKPHPRDQKSIGSCRCSW
jgi:predicted NBD/HSP70 family sugar kinase